MSMLFNRAAIVPMWLVVFGLFVLFESPLTFAAGLVLFLVAGVALTTMLVVWKQLHTIAPRTAPNPPLGVRELTLFDLDASRSAELAAKLGTRAKAGTNLAAAMAKADGLIHCTPTGMAKTPGMPLDAGLLRARHWVAEIVYFPMETELLRVARAKGCRTLDGGGMAVFQAVGAFRLFTGIEPDAGRMMRHFLSMDAG